MENMICEEKIYITENCLKNSLLFYPFKLIVKPYYKLRTENIKINL